MFIERSRIEFCHVNYSTLEGGREEPKYERAGTPQDD